MSAWLQDLLTFAVYTAAVAAAILHLRRVAGGDEGAAACGSCDHAPRGLGTPAVIPPPPSSPRAKRAQGLVVLNGRGGHHP
jgi:hypothetical protein